MLKLAIHWLVNAAALLAVAYIYPDRKSVV